MGRGRIIGFDPGHGITGWGVIDHSLDSPLGVNPHYGAITTQSALAAHLKMKHIYDESLRLLHYFQPEQAVVEKLYMNKNIKTAGDVYQARGVILAAIADFGCELIQLGPNKIKQMITGRGGATKNEVELMVQRLLNINTRIRPDDAGDALAGAIAGVMLVRSRNLFDAAKTAAGK